jgi:hypothetical protein
MPEPCGQPNGAVKLTLLDQKLRAYRAAVARYAAGRERWKSRACRRSRSRNSR